MRVVNQSHGETRSWGGEDAEAEVAGGEALLSPQGRKEIDWMDVFIP